MTYNFALFLQFMWIKELCLWRRETLGWLHWWHKHTLWSRKWRRMLNFKFRLSQAPFVSAWQFQCAAVSQVVVVT